MPRIRLCTARHVAALSVALLGFAPEASALTITADYSGFGTVYQDSTGVIYTTSGAGRTDVTATFQSDINTAIGYWQNAISLPWNETISFSFSDLGAGTIAQAGVDTVDANNRPATASIQFSTTALQTGTSIPRPGRTAPSACPAGPTTSAVS